MLTFGLFLFWPAYIRIPIGACLRRQPARRLSLAVAGLRGFSWARCSLVLSARRRCGGAVHWMADRPSRRGIGEVPLIPTCVLVPVVAQIPDNATDEEEDPEPPPAKTWTASSLAHIYIQPGRRFRRKLRRGHHTHSEKESRAVRFGKVAESRLSRNVMHGNLKTNSASPRACWVGWKAGISRCLLRVAATRILLPQAGPQAIAGHAAHRFLPPRFWILD